MGHGSVLCSHRLRRPLGRRTRDNGAILLTNKGKYGLKAMVHLAGLPPAEVAQGGEIAEATAFPRNSSTRYSPSFARQVWCIRKRERPAVTPWPNLLKASAWGRSSGCWTAPCADPMLKRDRIPALHRLRRRTTLPRAAHHAGGRNALAAVLELRSLSGGW